MSVFIESTVKPSDIDRPAPRRRLKRYTPPPPPLIRMYEVEVLQGADSRTSFPWWGPYDINEGCLTIIKEVKEEGFVPVTIGWED
jgi:hypothetical protein